MLMDTLQVDPHFDVSPNRCFTILKDGWVGGGLWSEIAFVACDRSQNHKRLDCCVAAVPSKPSICEDAQKAFFHNRFCFWPSWTCCWAGACRNPSTSTSRSTTRAAGGECHLKTPPCFGFKILMPRQKSWNPRWSPQFDIILQLSSHLLGNAVPPVGRKNSSRVSIFPSQCYHCSSLPGEESSGEWSHHQTLPTLAILLPIGINTFAKPTNMWVVYYLILWQ